MLQMPICASTLANSTIASKVRSVANTAMEREERALHLMEREVADREARVASRERMLVEREAKVGMACKWSEGDVT